MKLAHWISAVLCLLPAIGSGQTLLGKVIRIIDGADVLVQDPQRAVHTVRLCGIDAPKGAQFLSERSAQSLYQLAYGRSVLVEWYKLDGRCPQLRIPEKKCPLVGKILIEGEDMNLEQVRRGYARHAKNFAEEQSTTDRMLYREVESKAQKSQLGMWRRPSISRAGRW